MRSLLFFCREGGDENQKHSNTTHYILVWERPQSLTGEGIEGGLEVSEREKTGNTQNTKGTFTAGGLWIQQGFRGDFREQEEFLGQFMPGTPGAFEAGSNDAVDFASVHLGPFVEHAGAADDLADVRGKLVEFLPAVVQAPGDGFVDFDPGVIL